MAGDCCVWGCLAGRSQVLAMVQTQPAVTSSGRSRPLVPALILGSGLILNVTPMGVGPPPEGHFLILTAAQP